jgi:tRNA (guanine-N7-)-methyltransferase
LGKNKLKRFAENDTFGHVFQPVQKEMVNVDHEMKGKWNEFFKNDRPITLELGCGGGEYTVDFAKRFPERNYIGVDIKGARLWKGARIAHDQNLTNIAFIRTRIHNIISFFTAEEKIDELWITFPDPQPREGKAKKRLTSSEYLKKYREFAAPGCVVNLKTDSRFLFEYTLDEVVKAEGLEILTLSEDIYTDYQSGPLVEVQTFYEKMWLKDGLKIHYLQFKLFPNPA